MKREHKFRVRDKKQEKWIGVNLHMSITDGTLWWQFGYGCEPLSAEETENIELVPYIGIKDKNDNEIYRGDIVKIKRDAFFEYVSDVRFLHGSYCVSQFGTYFPIFSLARPGDTIEIISNVFTNPKLIEEAKPQQ